jgi:RecA-family ATPase
MDRLTPFLIRRFKDSGVEAVILDPIYKVITGDENDATEMSQFCSYFDRVCLEMGVAMIYCHHHSKGASAKYVKAADRSSGSGVFARDPDAILDLTELRLDAYARHRYQEQTPGCSESLTAWEMTGTLREFAPIEPVRLFFDYPLHRPDIWNFLAEARNDAMAETGRGVGKGQLTVEDWSVLLDEAYEANCDDGSLKVPFEAIAGYIQRDGKPAEKTIKNNISNSMIYTLYTDKKSGMVYVIKR